MLVQVGDGRLGVRPQLAGGGAKGVGGLQRMAALDPPSAAGAMADVDIELTDDGLAWNVCLILLVGAVLDDRPATVGATVRQWSIVDFVGRSRRDGAIGLGSIIRPRFAARPLGMILGRPLGKRGGLAFAGPQGILELAASW